MPLAVCVLVIYSYSPRDLSLAMSSAAFLLDFSLLQQINIILRHSPQHCLDVPGQILNKHGL